ncbi:MAG: hypothetical protein JXO44_07780 [Clostridia bacterium]|nr:hypothetical protein [Clostridia bacterium]
MKLNSREKLLVLLLVVFGALLIAKSTMEGYRMPVDASESEKAFCVWVDQKQAESYDGGLYQSGIFSIKLISVTERTQDGQVYYVAKLRKCFAKVIPFSDVFIKEEKEKFILGESNE